VGGGKGGRTAGEVDGLSHKSLTCAIKLTCGQLSCSVVVKCARSKRCVKGTRMGGLGAGSWVKRRGMMRPVAAQGRNQPLIWE
jgi:hypothetical protein